METNPETAKQQIVRVMEEFWSAVHGTCSGSSRPRESDGRSAVKSSLQPIASAASPSIIFSMPAAKLVESTPKVLQQDIT